MATAALTTSQNRPQETQLQQQESKPFPTRSDIILLLVLIAISCLAIEVGSSLFVGRVSKIRQRFDAQRAEALQVRRSGAGSPSVLLIGNSLLQRGINLPLLQQEVGGTARLTRYAISNTGYLDWYYGLRRLFHEGSRPDVVIVVLNPRQFISHGIAGDYAVHSMVDSQDLMKLASDLGSSNTEASTLVADRASGFYGSRSDIRVFALQMVFPRFEEVRDLITPPPPQLPTDEEIATRIAPRMDAIRRVCAEYGASMMLLVPPALGHDGSEGLKRAAARFGIRVLVPYAPDELTPDYFSDGVHLNGQGAARFTDRVAHLLRSSLGGNPIKPTRDQNARHAPATP